MKFTELSSEEYAIFLKGHTLDNFLQSPKMDALAKQKNQKVYYVGIKDGDKIICGARLLSTKTRFGKNNFYSPRGLIIDYNNIELLTKFTTELKRFIRSKNGYVLDIDPLVLYKERDIDGKLIENGFDNSEIVDSLKKIGYKHQGFTRGFDISRQVRWVFVLNLNNKTEDEIYLNMKPNTRNLISKAEKIGVKVTEISYDELKTFKKITSETGQRRNFSDKSMKYYETMYKQFVHDKEARFLIATLNVKEYLKNIEEETTKNKETLKELVNNGISSKSAKSKEKSLILSIKNSEKKLDEIEKIYKTDGENIVLSAAMFMTYGKEVIYSFSGNSEKYMKFNAQYLIQWEMIKYAIKNKFEKYDFYGISGIFDKQDSNYGVYEFKRGFNGNVEEYIGDFELPISNYYYINKLLKTIRKVVHK